MTARHHRLIDIDLQQYVESELARVGSERERIVAMWWYWTEYRKIYATASLHV